MVLLLLWLLMLVLLLLLVLVLLLLTLVMRSQRHRMWGTSSWCWGRLLVELVPRASA